MEMKSIFDTNAIKYKLDTKNLNYSHLIFSGERVILAGWDLNDITATIEAITNHDTLINKTIKLKYENHKLNELLYRLQDSIEDDIENGTLEYSVLNIIHEHKKLNI